MSGYMGTFQHVYGPCMVPGHPYSCVCHQGSAQWAMEELRREAEAKRKEELKNPPKRRITVRRGT